MRQGTNINSGKTIRSVHGSQRGRQQPGLAMAMRWNTSRAGAHSIYTLLIYALLIYAACIAAVTPARAIQILDAADHAELSAEISGSAVNRITLAGDRIARVIRAPSGFTVEHDAARGDIYLRPAALSNSGIAVQMGQSPVPDTVTLFLGTERGFTYRLTLSVAMRDSAQVMIRNQEAQVAASTALNSDSYQAELVALIRAAARREPLPGYVIEAPDAELGNGNIAPPVGANHHVTFIESWRGPRLTARVLSAPAGSFTDAAALGARFSPSIAAAWLAAPGSGPDGGRLAVVVHERRYEGGKAGKIQ